MDTEDIKEFVRLYREFENQWRGLTGSTFSDFMNYLEDMTNTKEV